MSALAALPPRERVYLQRMLDDGMKLPMALRLVEAGRFNA